MTRSVESGELKIESEDPDSVESIERMWSLRVKK